MSGARSSGGAARERGLPISANPYPEGSAAATWWREGYAGSRQEQAAAPDLLSALQSLVAINDEMAAVDHTVAVPSDAQVAAWWSAMDAARAAISKALSTEGGE